MWVVLNEILIIATVYDARYPTNLLKIILLRIRFLCGGEIIRFGDVMFPWGN